MTFCTNGDHGAPWWIDLAGLYKTAILNTNTITHTHIYIYIYVLHIVTVKNKYCDCIRRCLWWTCVLSIVTCRYGQRDGQQTQSVILNNVITILYYVILLLCYIIIFIKNKYHNHKEGHLCWACLPAGGAGVPRPAAAGDTARLCTVRQGPKGRGGEGSQPCLWFRSQGLKHVGGGGLLLW